MGFFSNVAHHVNVAKEALAEEKAQESQRRHLTGLKQHELEFMPAAIEVAETPAPPLGRIIMFSISLFFLIAVLWAYFSEIDIVAAGQGRIVPTLDVQVIQPIETGSIRAIHVRDGERVTKGQILIELDPTGAAADVKGLTEDRITTEAEIRRLTALLTDAPMDSFEAPPDTPEEIVAQQIAFLISELKRRDATRASLEGEIARVEAEQKTIKAEISRLEERLATINERFSSNQALFDKGVLPKMKFNESQEELGEAQGAVLVERQRLIESQATLRSVNANLAQSEAEFASETHAQLDEARKRLTSIRQELIKAEQRNYLQTLASPVEGIVQELAVRTIGGVVQPAQELMKIVPTEASFEVEAMILNKDIGSLEEGQDATLKIEAFPFTKYGTIDGTVRLLSADAVQDEQSGLVYPARVTMASTVMRADGRDVQLTPGMAVTVEVSTGTRRVIEFILAPLKRYQDESLRER